MSDANVLDTVAMERFMAWAADQGRWDSLPEPTREEVVVHHVRELPDRSVLGVIGQLSEAAYWPYPKPGHWVSRWDLAGALRLLGFRAHHGVNEMPSGYVVAKARRLLDRGLITGCGCGCRGDFELTAKGQALLAEAVAVERAS
ncbi:hypothetical protein [Nocardia africana]